jgi:hypothetical protein
MITTTRAFEEKKETLALVSKEITFVARRIMGIKWETMVVQQRAPSISPPMVGAMLGNSKFLI